MHLGHSAHVVHGFRVRTPDPAPAHHRPPDPAQGDCRERKVGNCGRTISRVAPDTEFAGYPVSG